MNDLYKLSWLIGLIVVMAGCSKPTLKTPAATSYHEDLTPYRIRLSDPHPVSLSQLELAIQTQPTALASLYPSTPVNPDNERIDEFCLLLAQKNQELVRDNTYKTSGYKIQIYSGKRELAEEAFKEAIKNYAYLKPEIRYEQPNFKVKLGNFMTKLEAHQIYVQLSVEFPNALIVKDEITIYLQDYKNE